MNCGTDLRRTGGRTSVKRRASILCAAAQRRCGPCVSKCIHFLNLTRPGATLGLILTVMLVPAYTGLCLRTGFGPAVDAACGLLLGAIILLSVTSVTMLGLVIVRHIPVRFGAMIVTTVICLIVAGRGFGFPPALSVRLGTLPILLLLLAGAGTSILLRRGPGRSGSVRTVIAAFMLVAALAGAGGLVYWLAAPGTDPFQENLRPAAGGAAVPLAAPNPAEAGPYPVARLCYGSGTDRRRPEYGRNVDLKTDSVDASSFITPPKKRWGLWVRKKYWGFEPNSLPLNARVWFPQEEGLFPLVLIVHGNHEMSEFSDPGYAYLGELLASRGFIVASIDENFLNYSWSGDLGEEDSTRGWLLLKHLELWRQWNEQKGNVFYAKVDLSSIALIGHSRGGDAIIRAAEFNRLTHHPSNANVAFHFGFDIRTLIAMAPTSSLHHLRGPSVLIKDINYLVLQGSHDGDLGCFYGAATYRRIMFTGQDYRMKAALYIYRANHSQFNTVWGRYDREPPLQYLFNQGSLLSPQEQRTIAKVYVSAFLEATLHGAEEYIPLFGNFRRAAHWLPTTIYFSQFQDSDFRTITDFDQYADVMETTIPGGSQRGEHLEIWEQRDMVTRRGGPAGSHAVVLGWNTTCAPGSVPAQVPGYVITLPDVLPPTWLLDDRMALCFSLADTGQRCQPAAGDSAEQAGTARHDSRANDDDPNGGRAPIDLTVELVASNGQVARLPLSHVFPLGPALNVTFTKWPYLERTRYKSPVEPVLQTFAIPLSDFAKANPEFDPGLLKQIRLRFDRTRTAVILLDDVGLANPYDSGKPGP
jgi:hypothetical protein